MRNLTQGLRITGYVVNIDLETSMMQVKARSGDVFDITVDAQTHFYLVRNSDKADRDRTDASEGNPLRRYLQKDQLVSSYVLLQQHEDRSHCAAKSVAVFGTDGEDYVFEEGHWWLTQITSFADTWLQRQFGLGSDFDFTTYRTNLDAAGGKVEDNPIQECDTISRLIYGLSSAYLLTGHQRYLKAAEQGVLYQRDMFRSVSDDGSFIVWQHGVVRGRKIMASEFDDDRGAIPLYEQIYALAGLAQYYRITQDWEVLEDIRRTFNCFELFFRDHGEHGGYFSHIDPATFSPDSPRLSDSERDNRMKKNWNSVGDHAPAYLLNVILALQDIPGYEDEAHRYTVIQEELADLICRKFRDPESPYVNERFLTDWTPDHGYRWQQNRAVVGHNLKIAWNLTRAYHLLHKQEYLDFATHLADTMPGAGMDLVRGGWYDVVERQPKNGMPLEFPWHNRKAWWQQEQAVLAYLILAGSAPDDGKKQEYLKLARESVAFWNLAFLDSDAGETYFDVLADGYPFMVNDRAQAASHSKSGYHSMELTYLAHIYYRLLVLRDRPLCLNFSLSANRNVDRVNVLPDCLPRDKVKIKKVTVNGKVHRNIDHERFQVLLTNERLRNRQMEVVVLLQAVDK
jgi:mannose/cellobiose epimerase-like protein (N-acyl-D-glucosamine 2-epimerase family)